jgi:hypothetical protein
MSNKETIKNKKTITVGDVISVSSVGDGASVAVGRNAQASNSNVNEKTVDSELIDWANRLKTLIDNQEDLDQEDKDELKIKVEQIKNEAAKRKKANVKRIGKLLKVIGVMSPEIFEVAIATLVNPLAGLGLVVKKIGEKVEVTLDN